MNRTSLTVSSAILAGFVLALTGCAIPSEGPSGAETAVTEEVTATPSPEEETLSEDQLAKARGLCEQHAVWSYPDGAIVHWAEDDLDPQRSEDRWVLMADATLTDASGVEHSDAEIECQFAVTGEWPEVDAFMGSY